MFTQQPVLTIGEAARLIRVSAKTLDRWRLMGAGPPYLRFGRLVRYGRDDLESFVRTSRISPDQEHATNSTSADPRDGKPMPAVEPCDRLVSLPATAVSESMRAVKQSSDPRAASHGKQK